MILAPCSTSSIHSVSVRRVIQYFLKKSQIWYASLKGGLYWFFHRAVQAHLEKASLFLGVWLSPDRPLAIRRRLQAGLPTVPLTRPGHLEKAPLFLGVWLSPNWTLAIRRRLQASLQRLLITPVQPGLNAPACFQ